MTAMQAPGWPAERGRESAVLLQFGEARAELARWALVAGDPLADAVVAETHENGQPARAALEQGIQGGLSSVPDAPPAVKALLTATEALPAFGGDDLLDRGSAPYYTSPVAVHMLSLSAGALIRVYESPSISRVLATTGRLIDGADRRIRETGTWLSTVMLPGSLRPGRPGYVATLQVRMLHAHMRHLARTRGFDEAAHGAPINQIDLARTWMDFTVTSLRAEEAMGFGLTTRETATLYRYWWLIAHLLGIDPRLVEGISTNEQAARADDLLQAVTGPLIDEAAALARATLESITGMLREALRVPGPLGSRAVQALARRFHGDAIADELQIPSPAGADAVIATAVKVIRARRARLRRDPGAWAAAQETNIAAARELLAGSDPALFQTHGGGS
jgi:ER-bound oxygenase mpaB/B'/Rubber oxygenase, catalytic domain